jgi:hypothetical protein
LTSLVVDFDGEEDDDCNPTTRGGGRRHHHVLDRLACKSGDRPHQK